MAFYHDQKGYMSPSALSTWVSSKVSFAKNYFEEASKVHTKSMEAGNVIHALIENGFMPAERRYDRNENELTVDVGKSGFKFMGRPDSFKEDGTRFVDYKSGLASDWQEKLSTDVKMRATAYLVWKECGKPNEVVGEIEFIPTMWNPDTKQIEPVEGAKHDVVEYTYYHEEMEQFEKFIERTMNEVNTFYLKWIQGSDQFIDKDDVEQYQDIEEQIEALELKKKDLAERIRDQMEFGGLFMHRNDRGAFYFRAKPEYQIPDELPVKVGSRVMAYWEIEEMVEASQVAIKNYKLVAEPATVTTSMTYKPVKKKK